MMKTYINTIFTILLTFSTFTGLKASGNDTISKTDTDQINSQLLENLDSLTNLWYVKQSMKVDLLERLEDTEVEEFPSFSDSIYAMRLENIPSIIDLPYNDKVRAFIELYTVKRRGLVEVMLGLTDYYFPLFEEILDKEGMPHEFKYLPIIESALNPRAVSRAGATGPWQFMYSTAKIYGLEINSFVDERRDPVKSTYAAIAFLKDLYDLYGDWTLALAAYNCGPGNVNKAIRRSKGKTDFWEIYYYLPRETRGYVPSFIAATYFMHYYKEHLLNPKDIEIPLMCDTVMIDEQLHLKQVAGVLDIDVEMLRDLNPQYRTDIIPAKTKKYPLRMPAEYALSFIEHEDSIYNFKDSIYFNKKMAVVQPPKNRYNRTYTPPPPGKNKTALYYTVKSGDNLGYISQWYNVRLMDLRYWNNIRGNMIRVGQKLVVYVPKSSKSQYEKINNMSFAQKQAMIGVKVNTSSTNNTIKKKTTSNTSSGTYHYYKVRSGDNPWTIARKYPGVSANDIMEANNISNSRGIKPGQTLKIPKK